MLTNREGARSESYSRVRITWLVCAIACGLHAWIMVVLARHGLPRDGGVGYLICTCTPYVFMALVGRAVRRTAFASMVLVAGVFLTAVPDLFLNLSDLPSLIASMDSQARGEEVMNCSPSPELMAFALSYLVSFCFSIFAIVASLVSAGGPGTGRSSMPGGKKPTPVNMQTL